MAHHEDDEKFFVGVIHSQAVGFRQFLANLKRQVAILEGLVPASETPPNTGVRYYDPGSGGPYDAYTWNVAIRVEPAGQGSRRTDTDDGD